LSECFPYGVFATAGSEPRVGVRVGDAVLDAGEAARRRGGTTAGVLQQPSLDPLLGAGPAVWAEVAGLVRDWAGAADAPLVAAGDVTMLLPFQVADYVDFYTSEQHAMNLSNLLRPGQAKLAPNWRHQPIGYHGRAGTVVVSGADVVRPHGHVATDGEVSLQPTARLDIEVEVGFVVGVPSRRGTPVDIADFSDHVFGLVLLNDWSARDIQAWETVPLGPFLGKSFQTSVSPWVVPLAALEAARVVPPSMSGQVSAYLREPAPWGLDIELELRVNGEVVSRPPYRTMHWSPAQMMAHLTVNGASLRTGDLYASGTVSGPAADQVGSLFEAWAGERFLADGDEVVISATAPAADGSRLDLGQVCGRVLPARSG
jgi:fumarylacetoacetase